MERKKVSPYFLTLHNNYCPAVPEQRVHVFERIPRERLRHIEIEEAVGAHLQESRERVHSTTGWHGITTKGYT